MEPENVVIENTQLFLGSAYMEKLLKSICSSSKSIMTSHQTDISIQCECMQKSELCTQAGGVERAMRINMYGQ